jgi:hypothetical protein
VPNNILITPGSASIQFSGSAANTIRLQVEQSGSIAFYGNSGSLFGITDVLSGSLMSVNDISGLPILEVFSDDRVVMGTFNKNTLVVTGSRIGIDKANPTADLDISGSVFITGSLRMNSGGITGSLFGTSSFATTASFALNASGGSTFPFNGNAVITGSLIITGSAGLTVSGSASFANDVIMDGVVRNRLNLSTQTTNYTLALGDEGRLIFMASGGANIVTVPSSSTVNFPIGAQVMLTQSGSGQTRFTSASTGVTLLSANNALKIANRYSAATLIKTNANAWYLFGDITV